MNKVKTTIFVLVVIVVVALIIYFVFIPQVKEIARLWAENSIKEDRIKELNQELANANKTENQASKINDLKGKVKEYVPDKKNTGDFLISLEAMAKSTNNALSNIKFTQPKTATPTASPAATGKTTNTGAESTVKGTSTQSTSSSSLKEMGFEVNLTGNFSSIMNFLSELNNLNRFNTLDKVDLDLSGETLQAYISGKIYYTL